ncbi:disulfide bond formation protein B [Ruegeria arenilitoris]|uniref:disulfide bond formation protein B n=1 Tax=Ruegeria arenilitoris TaxID=1173585 RepID=UPI00147C110E|nr:disulfide bond formation protein B [Ruegeria arenilitoris]
MSRRRILVILASGGSAILLLAAWGFQYIGELSPCKMCIWQRYPHGAAVLLGVLAFAVPSLSLTYLLGALAALTTAGIGIFHAGVEQGLWQGPSTCTSGDVGALSQQDLFNQIMNAPLVRCDEIPWEFLGLSMAGWNAVTSAGLALIWIAAWRAR